MDAHDLQLRGRARPCVTCPQLSLQASLSRRTAIEDEFWHIEARRTVAFLAALIRTAEATLDFRDRDKWERDQQLEQAIATAGAALEQRRREPDAFYAWVHGEEIIDALANAIAQRNGETARQHWDTVQLGYLCARALRS